MVAAIEPRMTALKGETMQRSLSVAAGQKIWLGTMVGRHPTTGLAIVGGTGGANAKIIGRALQNADNTNGIDRAITVLIESGIYCFANANDDIPIIMDTNVYAADDQTIAATQGTKPLAGTLFETDAEGVWVRIGY
ncbi:MAG: hypothetical protein QM537_01460 [Candidatus Symbiobacter sp.]|nr:hypothetical protein [Candidatus Symbiobacter sp.]